MLGLHPGFGALLLHSEGFTMKVHSFHPTLYTPPEIPGWPGTPLLSHAETLPEVFAVERSFIINLHYGGAGVSGQNNCRARFLSPTQVEVRRGVAEGDLAAQVWVVELSVGAKVQALYGKAGNVNAVIPEAVDTDKAFIVGSYSSTDSSTGPTMPKLYDFASPTAVAIPTGADDETHDIFVVEGQ